MDKHSLFIFAVGFCCACATIEIKELNVPDSIEYGTIDEIILDCNYEANKVTDLELKWYYNNQTVYQWIPDSHKSGSAWAPFKDLIDLEYNISNDTNPVYRAIKIINVTRHLTGNYSCRVSSYEHEDFKTKQLIIYSAPTSGLDIMLMDEQEVVCNAIGVFPEPKINIYISGENDTKTEVDEITVTDKDDNGLFNVTTTYDFSDLNNATNPTKFVCELSIPGTDYHISKYVDYYIEIDDINDIEDEDSSNITDFYDSYTYDSTEAYFNTTKVNSVMAVSSSIYLSTLPLVLLVIKSNCML